MGRNRKTKKINIATCIITLLLLTVGFSGCLKPQYRNMTVRVISESNESLTLTTDQGYYVINDGSGTIIDFVPEEQFNDYKIPVDAVYRFIPPYMTEAKNFEPGFIFEYRIDSNVTYCSVPIRTVNEIVYMPGNQNFYILMMEDGSNDILWAYDEREVDLKTFEPPEGAGLYLVEPSTFERGEDKYQPIFDINEAADIITVKE